MSTTCTSRSEEDDNVNRGEEERVLTAAVLTAATSAATTVYSAYAGQQPHRYPIAVSIGTDTGSTGRERSFSLVVPTDKTVSWLRERAAEHLEVDVPVLAYRGNRVPLNDNDLVFDACRALSPAHRDDMLVVVTTAMLLSYATNSNA